MKIIKWAAITLFTILILIFGFTYWFVSQDDFVDQINAYVENENIDEEISHCDQWAVGLSKYIRINIGPIVNSNDLDHWHSSLNDEILSDLKVYSEYFSNTGCTSPFLNRQNKYEKLPDYESIYHRLTIMTSHIRLILHGDKDLRHLYELRGFKGRYDDLIEALNKYKDSFRA